VSPTVFGLGRVLHKSAFSKGGLINDRFAPKATEVLCCREVSRCAKSCREQVQQKSAHLVGNSEHARRHVKTQCFGGLKIVVPDISDQFKN
jgi:hypothetical protein